MSAGEAGSSALPRPARPDALIVTTDLCRWYRVGGETIKAVDQVNWEVNPGRLIALRGRSGSGKTTLLNLIGALDQPTSGDVYFRGQCITRTPEYQLTGLRRHNFGFVFQSFALLPVLSALENVELTMRIAGRPAAERDARAREALDMVGLGPRMDHRPFELSGGEQQRVSIARAIANRPSVLIADEPTGELDSITGVEIMLLFRRVVEQEGVTIVMATHDPALSQFADETYLMEDGRLSRAEGPLEIDLPELRQHVEFVERGGPR